MLTKEVIQAKIDSKTKPLGSLGMLEKLALQIGMTQQTLSPQLVNPHILVFAGDHGIAEAGVSAYPQSVTYQMVMNFVKGGAAINVFCRQNQIQLKIIDTGVNFDFPESPSLIRAKIAYGTANFLETSAMSEEALKLSIQFGGQMIDELKKSNCNVVGFGEMGIGNTSSAALLMRRLCNLPLEACVGRGTGLDDAQWQRKLELLQQADDFHEKNSQPLKVLQTFGGFEMAQMFGAMLSAFEQDMLLLIDGFIATSVFLVAYKLKPEIKKNAIFCHCSDEKGHRLLLDYLEAEPILNLGMRLGEGTGCAVAYPIIQSAAAFLNEMASFESAGVSNK